MKPYLAKIKNISGVALTLLFISGFEAKMAMWATGRSGPCPFGEDSWRWSLMSSTLFAPSWLASFMFGLVLFGLLRAHGEVNLKKMMVGVALLQLVSAFLVLSWLVWPNVIYHPPQCE